MSLRPGKDPVPSLDTRPQPAGVEHVELWAQSTFSFLEGASMPEELVEQGRALGLRALGLCDRDGVYGMVRAWKKGKELGLPVLHGALLTVADPGARRVSAGPDGEGTRELVVYAQDEAGWGRLCELLSRGRAEQEKGSSLLTLAQVCELSAGLVALADTPWGDPLVEAFGDRLYVAASAQLLPGDAARIATAEAWSRRIGRPVVAVSRALVHAAERQRVQDVLTCIRLGVSLDKAGTALQPNAERRLRSGAELAALLPPAWVARSLEAAERCTFDLDQLHYNYPREVVPEGHDSMSYLREQVELGLKRRWPRGVPPAVRATVEHELRIIGELNFPAYFLTVYDIVRFAREQGILCQGRGSAANSAVCYALGITAVDPSRQRVLFERFISKERAEPPDIDVDFEHERREEVIQYVYRRYGRHRAAMVNEIISYRPRSAVRDVGKAMGLSLDQVDRLAKGLEWFDDGADEATARNAGLDPTDWRVSRTLEIAREIQGFPRHLSIHVGGFVISEEPLRERCPIEPASMADRTVIQWDKDDVDAVRFVKVDVLALGILTAIRKCFDLIRLHHGRDLELATVPAEDPHVYDMIGRADTMGTFQVESRAQMSMLPRLKPRNFYDLVIEVSIVRPGPIQGGMVHPYLDRRSGVEPIRYAHPALMPILERTLGVPIFQEQVMEMAMAVGGFSAGEADQLRRAMGAWRKRGGLEPLVERLSKNMREKGISGEYASQVARQIIGFGEYGFPESHAASFALIVYVSCWLKYYYPAAYTASLLNAQPMGFYGPRNLVDGARRHGVSVRPVDVAVSDWDNTLEPEEGANPKAGGEAGIPAEGVALRLGLRQVSGLGEEAARRIEIARRERPFKDIADLALRADLDRGELGLLARADALLCFGLDRRQAAWTVEGLHSAPLLRGLGRNDRVPLPTPGPLEELQADYKAMALSLERHPIGLVRASLDRRRVVRIADLADHEPGDLLRIAGLVVNRQRPGTASGVVFMTLEDETGMANLVVWPKLFEKQRQLIRGEQVLEVEGVLQKEGDAFSILARTFRPLPLGKMAGEGRAEAGLRAPSRDFR